MPPLVSTGPTLWPSNALPPLRELSTRLAFLLCFSNTLVRGRGSGLRRVLRENFEGAISEWASAPSAIARVTRTRGVSLDVHNRLPGACLNTSLRRAPGL